MWKVRVFQKHPAAIRPRHLVPAAWVGAMGGGLLLAPRSRLGPLAALAAFVAWLVVIPAASLRIPADGTSRWRLVAALATLHLAYGTGLWLGVVRFAPRWLIDRRGRRERLAETGP
jgi:hypothetical protein